MKQPRIQKDFSYNKIGLKDGCYKLSNSKTLFYVTGDCQSRIFAHMLDKSQLVENLYLSEDRGISYISKECVNNNKECDLEKYKVKKYHLDNINNINKMTKNFENIFLINTWLTNKWQEPLIAVSVKENLYNYIESIDPKINIILIAPRPRWDAKPFLCFASDSQETSFIKLNKDILGCTISKEKDLEERIEIINLYKSMSDQFNNVYFYDFSDKMCPEDTCFLYDKEKDIIWNSDDYSLSVEGANELSSHFSSWLANTFKHSL
jgi:hypothetical protein